MSRDPIGELSFALNHIYQGHQLFDGANIKITGTVAEKLQKLRNLAYRVKLEIDQNKSVPVYLFGHNDGVNKVDGLGLLEIHGNWCGPNWTGGMPKASYDFPWLSYLMGSGYPPSIDDLDSCCFTHDACCAGINNPMDYSELLAPLWRGGCSRACNDNLCSCAKKSTTFGAARNGIICYFCSVDPITGP
jgi:hypothetical protein